MLVNIPDNTADGSYSNTYFDKLQTFVPCLPLETLLLTLNRTTVDYLSLNMEWKTMDILNTIDFQQFDIKMISISYGDESQPEIDTQYLVTRGYSLFKEIAGNKNNTSHLLYTKVLKG